MSLTVISSIIVSLLVAFKVYMKYSMGKCKSKVTLYGKTAIVTGSNTGIGYETAKDLARRGARVILACRDLTKANIARDKIVLETKNENVLVRKLNFESLKSVRDFARDFLASEDRLDILVNNAGAINLENKKTEDDIQITLQINYFSAFLLTNLLLGKLKECSPSRIVMVSGLSYSFANVDLNDIKMDTTYTKELKALCNCQLFKIVLANEITRRLKGSGVTANSLHPGGVQTEIFRNLPGWQRILIHTITKLFLKTAEEGAQTVVYLAVSEEVENVSGEYFVDCKRTSMSSKARDPIFCNRVWELSEEIVKLSPSERHY